jgi:hypothetical protein
MSRHGSAMARPVYLQQRTYLVTVAMAVVCHKATYAVQQGFGSYFVAGRRTVNTEPLPGSLATVTSPPIS